MGMKWEDFVAKHKKAFVEHWFEDVVLTYPEETVRFIKSEKNPFLNPVGAAIKEGIEGVVDWLVVGYGESKEEEGAEEEDSGLVTFLDRIIRVRAVQEFKPSEALRFIQSLKRVFRKLLASSDDEIEGGELEEFDSVVDEVMLKALDIYSACREQLYELRVQEVKNRTFRLLQRAGLVYEISGEEAGQEGRE
ncbi:MAG: RsbRD N-terminal domain-containing protein [Deltaproteobacteria bacterium]|nr:RsbRD N-terminal domain-containing protein [Deltaproteobacteria bacterium]MBW2067337.1 RsbRD N-terminal domain-containing protein [Deltaproteobacteria bacterium]